MSDEKNLKIAKLQAKVANLKFKLIRYKTSRDYFRTQIELALSAHQDHNELMVPYFRTAIKKSRIEESSDDDNDSEAFDEVDRALMASPYEDHSSFNEVDRCIMNNELDDNAQTSFKDVLKKIET